MNKEEGREIVVQAVPNEVGYIDVIKSQMDLILGNRENTIHEPLMEDRLIDIYVFTGIVVATILVTLCRSFLFFSVC